MSVVVRFAPSPTGQLHLGGARTALFNWLFGRSQSDGEGKVLLRLEDTDPVRSEERHAQSIIEALRWLGLNWDGEVLHQSDRIPLYQKHLSQLEKSGHAYRCYCPPENLEKAREMARAVGRHWRYPRTCRELDGPPCPGTPYVLRLKVPEVEAPAVNDRIVGRIAIGGPDIDDFVLTRSDGSPLYNICCVVDDALSGVTHVVRGADHVDNTRRQTLLIDALGFPRPEYAHLPLVAGLSKRLGSDSVLTYRDRGYLPEAILNYVARLGWSHGDQEVFSLDELVTLFRLVDVGHNTANINKDKLRWLNEQHLHRASGKRLAELLRPWLGELSDEAESRLVAACSIYRTRCGTLIDMTKALVPCLVADEEIDLHHSAAPKLLEPTLRDVLSDLAKLVRLIVPFERHVLKQSMWDLLSAKGLGFRKVAPTIRLALTGNPDGPRILDLMIVLGPKSVTRRLTRAAEQVYPPTNEEGDG